jgi:septal ring factor EnvC (AmiA/AmiB activator)
VITLSGFHCFQLFFPTEYDSLQDTSENQASQIKVLNKDLEQSVQECIRTKEKLAATETDLSDKTLRLGSVSAELGECQSRVKSLEDEKQRQEKTIAKLSAENKELVKSLSSGINPDRV